ncbi:ankyrin repeat-containing domain protein [Aspergillus aurantiobrunneus]
MATDSHLRWSEIPAHGQIKGLLSLPDELILLVGHELSLHSLNALVQTSKRFYFALTSRLYKLMLVENYPHSNSTNAMIIAASTGNLATFKKLLTFVTPQDDWFKSHSFQAFRAATRNGHDHIVRFLLKAGVRCRPEDMKMLMVRAAGRNHVKTVEVLIDAGADISSSPRTLDECPVTTAARSYEGDPAMVKLLCDRGANKDPKDDWQSVLHVLARIGGFDMLKFFLDMGSSVDAPNATGNTPLFFAIQREHHSAVLLLLSRGASVSVRNDAGNTPLLVAAMNRGTSAAAIVQLLLDYGADVNARSRSNRTPLHLATTGSGGDEKIVKILLQAGADCRAMVDENDRATPLLNAMSTGYYQHPRIPLLIDAGGAESPGQDTRSLITWAVYHNLLELLKKLIDNSADPGLPAFLETLPLIESIRPGREEILRFLLTIVTNVNWKSPDGITPLIQAATCGASPDTIRLLLERGAHADAKDTYGCIALMFAAQSNSTEATAMILERTAQPDAVDSTDQSALNYAIEGQKEDTVDLLLKHGLSPVQENNALMRAVRHGNPHIVRSLLNYSVNAETRDHGDIIGDTRLTVACRLGNHAMAEVLLNAGSNPETQADHGTTSFPHSRSPLCIACDGNNPSLVRLLLERGADVEATAQAGQKPLGIAATKRQTDIASLLLAHGANVNAPVSNPGLHRTALIIAAQNGHVETAALLLAHNAAVSATDYYGRTALSHAAENGHTETIQLLLNAGSELDAPDCKGHTPLYWAVTQGDPHAAEILVRAGADVARGDREGLTPISLAMRSGDESVIRVLYQ